MQLQEKVNERIKLIVVSTVLLGGLLLGSCERQQPPAPPRMPEVATVTISTEQVMLTTELPGRTSAYLIAEIRPQVNGLIQKRLFTEGSDVKDGQVLYQIDPAPFQAALDNAAANLAAMRKAADRARAALAESTAGVTGQRATLELARTNRQRFEDLFKKRFVSASDRDQAATNAEVAEATLRAVEAHVENDRQAVAAAEAAIQQAEAALETARINLGYTRITAPIPGRIGRSNVTDRRPGDGVSTRRPGDDSTTGPHLRGCSPIHCRTAAIEAQDGGGRPESKWNEPEQGQAHPGRRHGISAGRDPSISRCHGGPDDRFRYSAGRCAQSERGAPAGHVRQGTGERGG